MRARAAALASVVLAATLFPAPAETPVTLPQPFLTLSAAGQNLALGPRDIRALEISESGGITDIFLRLEGEATAALADLTAAAVGRRVVLSVCGEALIAPVVQEATDSGTIYIAGVTAQDAEDLRALWHGRVRCEDGDTDAQ